jgi:hypothetical protein
MTPLVILRELRPKSDAIHCERSIVWQEEPAMRRRMTGPDKPVEQTRRGVRMRSLLTGGSKPGGRKRNRWTWSHVMDDWDFRA